jgi:hypothetical protein
MSTKRLRQTIREYSQWDGSDANTAYQELRELGRALRVLMEAGRLEWGPGDSGAVIEACKVVREAAEEWR